MDKIYEHKEAKEEEIGVIKMGNNKGKDESFCCQDTIEGWILYRL